MFTIDETATSDADARDVLGELANVVTGNVKSPLPAPSALSMPAVSFARGCFDGAPPVAGTVLLRRVAFAATTGTLYVSVWEAEAR